MTRFSLNYNVADMRKLAKANFDDIKKKYPTRLTESWEDHIKPMDDINNDPLFRTAVRVVHILTELSTPIHEAILAVEAKSGMNLRTPLLTPNKQKDKENVGRKIFFLPGSKPETIRVFPEIWLTSFDRHSYLEPKEVHNISAYFPFYLNHWYEEAKKNSTAWNPLSRALTRMFKSVEVTVGAALQRYTKFPASFSERDINSFAEQIVNFRRPAEIVEARTPEDFIAMYWHADGPSSCMTKTAGEASRWLDLVDNKRVHPTAWYAYTGNTFGLYMKKGREVVARAIVYNKAAKGVKPVYELGRLYSTNDFSRAKMIEEAKKRGIGVGALKEFFLQHTDWEFEVPVVYDEANDRKVIPFPFIDNLANGFQMKYDKDKDVVKFKSDIHSPQGNVRIQQGYIDVNTISKRLCDSCGGQMGNIRPISTQDGAYVVCGVGCLDRVGYTFAMDADGTNRAIRKDAAVPVRYCEDQPDQVRAYHTTIDAAIRRRNAAPGLIHRYTKNGDLIFMDREDDEVYVPYTREHFIASGKHTYSRSLPLSIQKISGWDSSLPTKVNIPTNIKQVAAVEIADTDHYLDDDMKKLLEEVVASVNTEVDVVAASKEVAPGVPADVAPKGPIKEKRSPVRFVQNLGD